MGETTGIEWTQRTWNPVTGCDRVSPGCAHCYALTMAKRLKAAGVARYQKDGGPASGPGFGLTLQEDKITEPLRWRSPSVVFVNSMSDLFHEDVPDDFIDRVFATMALTPQHTYQVLTKRPERMRGYVLGLYYRLRGRGPDGTYFTREAEESVALNSMQTTRWPLPNVWLGISAENQRWLDERVPPLQETPAAVRFVSCEPLLGPLDFAGWQPEGVSVPMLESSEWDGETVPGLDWVIVGGESGPKARPMELDWARSIRDQCIAAGVPFFFKQVGGRTPKEGGRLLDGREWNEMPS